ncbi:unnamed protein product [Calicophoron daubneyi]|uniref:SLED domain-containing protein n=1 Tax=Calicophoron daubneyi TaxID=300641 RepID=A0AAV2TBN4_CALDB
MPFDWHVYLSETGAELSPPVLFDHVSRSLEPLVHKGETLEVLWSVGSTNPGEQKWWPAEVVLVSGYLLLLKWWVPEKPVTELHPVPPASKRPMKCPKIPSVTNNEGFWFDVKGSNWDRVRQIGWCRSKNIAWTPPDHVLTVDAALLSPFSEYEEKLQKRSVARPFFEQHALYPFETIRSGGYLECEHEDNPGCVWPAKVLMNIGGRVKLAWFGTDVKQSVNGGADPKSIFTLFYLHRRIHLLGWGKIYGLKYCPPPDVTVDRAISNIDAFIRGAPSAFTLASDQDGGNKLKSIRAGHPMYQRDPPLHEFKKGWKVEAVNPLKPYLVQPATIAEVFNSRYFLVELDDLRRLPGNDNSESTWKVKSELPKPIRFVCHAGSSVIMPVNTSQLRGIHLAPPPGWPEKRPFTWTNYLTFLSMASNPPHCVNDSSETLTAECLVPDDLKVSACIKQSLFTDQGLTPSESSSDATDGCSSHVCAGNTLLHADCIPYCPPEAMFRGIRISGSFSGQSEVNRSNTIPQPNTIPNLLEIQTKEPMYSLPVERATSRFLLGMKLEMVISDHLSSHTTQQFAIGPGLCAATVTRVDGPYLLWVLPDLHSAEPIKPIMMDARSTQLYPVGWSAACGHPIVAPEGYANCSVDAETGLPTVDLTCSPSSNYNMDSSIKHWNVELKSTHDLQYHTIEYQNEEVCPPIFINPKCYIGPFLCKTSVELIPRRIGPGPITRVMQYLLTRLISAAYKPVRVLHMFEADWATNLASALNLRPNQPNVGLTHDSIPTRGRFNIHGGRVNVTHAESEMVEQRRSAMQLVVLRIRCPRRGIKVEAPVEVCGRVRAVEEFCRQVFVFTFCLLCCPVLGANFP